MIDTIFCNDPYLVLILGDFNAKLSTWRADDIDNKWVLVSTTLPRHMD